MRRNPIRRLEPPHFISASVAGLFALLACSVSAQNPLPTPGIPTEAEVERVIVTGSNIPTAEEVGPNPVDTYRPARHREIRRAQRNRLADQAAAGDGLDH